MVSETEIRHLCGPGSRLGDESVARPEIALLLSTYQKPWHLARVLTSIAMQKGVLERMELVVTDDGSTDDTYQIVRDFAKTVPFPVCFTTHRHEGFQLSRCHNEGAAASQAPYLLILDGDCVLPPDHVEKHLRHRKQHVTMAGYYYRLDRETSSRIDDDLIRAGDCFAWRPREEHRFLNRLDWKSRFYQAIGHPTKPKLFGGNIGVWRKDFERVNGFDEQFVGWGCEDDDFRLRLRRAGIHIQSILRWTRTYHLWHPPATTAPQAWRDGLNVEYLNRTGRLTRCMQGQVRRHVSDLAVRVVGEPERPDVAEALLTSHGLTISNSRSAEIEVLFLPGKGRFGKKADCRLLVAFEQTNQPVKHADLVVSNQPIAGVNPKQQFPLEQFGKAIETIVGGQTEWSAFGNRNEDAAA